MVSMVKNYVPTSRHQACDTWDVRGYKCQAVHDCDSLTVVSVRQSGRVSDILTGDPAMSMVTLNPAGRGAHRAA